MDSVPANCKTQLIKKQNKLTKLLKSNDETPEFVDYLQKEVKAYWTFVAENVEEIAKDPELKNLKDRFVNAYFATF